MATLRPQSGELIEAAFRPMLAEETKAAEGWPELHLEPASWIEGDQVWILELQPYDPPKAGGDLEETHQLASDEKVEGLSSSGQSRPSPRKGTEVQEYQSWSGEAPLQTKGTYISDGEAFGQGLQLTTAQSTHTKNVHICDQYSKGFQSFSDLAQHYQHLHSREKTSGQEQSQTVSCSQSALAPTSLPLKVESMFVDSCERICPEQMQTTEQSAPTKKLHICPHCGKGYRWRSDLARHQRVHYGRKAAKQRECQLEAGSLVPVPLNTFVSPVSVSKTKSKLTTNRNINTKNLHACDQCGKAYRWRSDLYRHLRIQHHIKSGKQRESQPEASPLVPVSLQEENTFVSPGSTFRPKLKPKTDQSTHGKKQHICDLCGKGCRKPCELALHYQRHHPGREVAKQRENELKPMTGQSTHTKNQPICNLCGKGFRWPSDLARHYDVCYRRKAAERREHQSEAGPLVPILLPLQEENAFDSPASALRPKSKLTTNRNTHSNDLHICDRCGMGYQWLSHLALHRSVHHGIKASKQRERRSEASPLVSVSLQEESMFVSPESKFRPKSKPITGQSTPTKNQHICPRCGKGYRWPSDLARHRHVHYGRKASKQREHQSEAGPLVPVPLPLQEENTFVSPASVSKPNSKLATNENTHTKNLHVCDQCGKAYRWRCDRVRHQRMHHGRKAAKAGYPGHIYTHTKALHICDQCGKGYRWRCDLVRHLRVQHDTKASKQRKSPSEASPPVSVSLQEENTFVSPVSLFTPKSEPMTGQSTCPRNQNICDQCERGCQKSCELAQQDQCHHSGQKATTQGQCQLDSYSCSALAPISLPLQTENAFADSCETVSQKLKLMTDQHTCPQKLPTCGQGGKGFQCPSELMHHDRCMHSGEKAAVQNLHQCAHSGKYFQCRSGPASCLFAHFGKQASLQRWCPSEAPSPSPLASVPLQVKNVVANSPAIFSPKSMLMADQSTHTLDPHICDQYQNGLWWPSEPAQHPCVHSGGKVARWGQFCSKRGSPSHLVSYSLQTEYAAANFNKIFYPNSQLATDQSGTHLHTCGQCGKACRWPPALDQHQHVHSGVELARQGRSQSAACSPIISTPLPLQEENMITNSKQMRDQGTEAQNLHICSHSGNGLQWPSELTQYPCVHSWEGVARGGQCQSKVDESCLTMSVTASLQVISTFANCQKAISQNSKQMTECAHSKKPCLQDHSGEAFHGPSDLTRHTLTHSRERPHSCAVCGSQFTRKVQLVKHQRLHEETHDSDREEEDRRHQGGEEVPREDIPTEQQQWLPPQGTEELCEPFASSKACECDACPTGASNSPEPPPPNSMWEIGASGQPYILSLGHSCECDNCGSYDSSTIDIQHSEPSSLGADDTVSSNSTSSPVGFCDTSTPMVLTATGGEDENVEDMLKKRCCPASPITSRRARQSSAVGSQNLKETPSLSTKEDPPLVGEGKLYACPKCRKQFGSRYNFTRHLAIHQKRKPHKCKTCGDCFAHRSYLLKHQRRHTIPS